jgi:hypothetical protein
MSFNGYVHIFSPFFAESRSSVFGINLSSMRDRVRRKHRLPTREPKVSRIWSRQTRSCTNTSTWSARYHCHRRSRRGGGYATPYLAAEVQYRRVVWVIRVQRLWPGTRHRRRSAIEARAAQHYGRVGHLLLFHQLPQSGGVLHRQPPAAVRYRMAKIALLVGAVDSVAGLDEEDRRGHRRVVPFMPRARGLEG